MKSLFTRISVGALVLTSAILSTSALADDTPKVECTLSDRVENNLPGPSVSAVSPSNPGFLICVSPDIKKGQTMTASYMSAAAPPGTPGITKSVTANEDATDDRPFIANLNLDPNPNLKGEEGKYTVDISVGTTVVQSISFDLKQQ